MGIHGDDLACGATLKWPLEEQHAFLATLRSRSISKRVKVQQLRLLWRNGMLTPHCMQRLHPLKGQQKVRTKNKWPKGNQNIWFLPSFRSTSSTTYFLVSSSLPNLEEKHVVCHCPPKWNPQQKTSVSVFQTCYGNDLFSDLPLPYLKVFPG